MTPSPAAGGRSREPAPQAPREPVPGAGAAGRRRHGGRRAAGGEVAGDARRRSVRGGVLRDAARAAGAYAGAGARGAGGAARSRATPRSSVLGARMARVGGGHDVRAPRRRGRAAGARVRGALRRPGAHAGDSARDLGGGTLSVGTTLLLALVCPIWMFICLPSWLAWRVLHPLGRGRLSLPRALVLLAVAAGAGARPARHRRFHRRRRRGSLPLRRTCPPTPGRRWRRCARPSGSATRRGPTASSTRSPSSPRAGSSPGWRGATASNGWSPRPCGAVTPTTATRYARLGAGTALRSAGGAERRRRGLAAAVAGRRGRVWLLWAAAPCRALTWPLVRAARRPGLARRDVAAGADVGGARRGDEAPAARPLALRHLQLVAAAAGGAGQRGRPCSRWPANGRATWTKRPARGYTPARSPSARAGGERARALRERRDRRAGGAGGVRRRSRPAPPAPETDVSDGPVSRELRARSGPDCSNGSLRRSRRSADGRRAPPGNVLAAWERWLAVRSAIERAEAFAGTEAVIALWYGGVRDAVWAWGCALFSDRRARSGWAAHMMFSWIAERAELYGDFPATLLDRRTRAARSPTPETATGIRSSCRPRSVSDLTVRIDRAVDVDVAGPAFSRSPASG